MNRKTAFWQILACWTIAVLMSSCSHDKGMNSQTEDLTADELNALSEQVAQWVRQGEVVGAEYVIIQQGEVLLHETQGWRDRENGLELVPNTIFQIQSMTKPMLATAILMLQAEGLLSVDSSVATYLPSYANEKSSGVTIKQLLTRTAGYTQATFNPFDFPSLRAAVDEIGRLGPDVTPGTVFARTSQGSWILGALVEELSRMPAEDFIRSRILEAIGMTENTHTLLKADDAWKSRLSARYYHTESGDFEKFWALDDAPPFPFFPASAGVYSTPLDYAKFLELWMNEGRSGSRQLISPQLVASALKVEPLSAATTPYGWHWDIGPGVLRPGTGLDSFGHPGIDGTIGWVVPEKELIILYFTQSRGGITHFLFVEEVLRMLQ